MASPFLVGPNSLLWVLDSRGFFGGKTIGLLPRLMGGHCPDYMFFPDNFCLHWTDAQIAMLGCEILYII